MRVKFGDLKLKFSNISRKYVPFFNIGIPRKKEENATSKSDVKKKEKKRKSFKSYDQTWNNLQQTSPRILDMIKKCYLSTFKIEEDKVRTFFFCSKC